MQPMLLLATAVAAALPISFASAAQPRPPAPQAAENLADFDFVTSKIRNNYAGWHTKVTPATRPQLDALTMRLRARAATASNSDLLKTLREWIAFFNDRHVGIAPTGSSSASTSNANFPSVEWDQLIRRLQALSTARDPLEGVWNIQGDLYRLAVLRVPGSSDRFEAVVLSTKSPTWKPGQIKAEFTRRTDGRFDSIFRPGDHSEQEQVSELIATGQAIMVPGWDTWQREWPAVPDAKVLNRMLPPRELSLEAYSPTTLLLRIPDFRDNRAQAMRDLIAQHKAKLDQTPNLIIDLRNNGGGSDFVYDPIVPYLYTRPIVSISAEMRSSPDNIALRQAVAEELKANSPETAAEIERQNKEMRKRPGQYVPQETRQFGIDRRASVLPNPRRVAVLIDGAGSSGEEFLLMARQSRKVTLFGQRNSAGILDFANVIGTSSPSNRFRLSWATSRSLRLPEDPVDPDGIPPDIRIPESVVDPVAFAADWLGRQVD